MKRILIPDTLRKPDNLPLGHWNDLSTQRTFMDNLAKKLKITDRQAWYHITLRTIRKHGGTGLLAKYQNSPSKILATVYSEYPLL